MKFRCRHDLGGACPETNSNRTLAVVTLAIAKSTLRSAKGAFAAHYLLRRTWDDEIARRGDPIALTITEGEDYV